MIELTATHQKIIERQADGWSDQKIERVLGLKNSEFLAALQHIQRWREENKPRRVVEIVHLETDLVHDAAVYRVLAGSKEPLLARDVGEQVGLCTQDASTILKRLKRRKQAINAGRYMWKAV